MSKINIRGEKEITDSFYRYKMSRMNLKVEGTKTIISNLSEVAKDINRPIKNILNFFGKSLGCSTNYDLKNNKAIISKVITLSDLEPKLFSYIDIYVLCTTCSNPETVIEEGKKGLIKICSACGNKNVVCINK
jgi:translation initiation factor 5